MSIVNSLKKFAGKGKKNGIIPGGESQVEGFVYYFSLVGRQTAMQKIDGAGKREKLLEHQYFLWL